MQAKETQLIACNNLAEILEDKTMKLTAARYEIRDPLRRRNDCSEQLTATKHVLNSTEIKLKDTNDVLNRTKADKCKQTKAASNSATEKDSGCIRQLAVAQSSLRAKETALRNVSSHLTQEHEAKLSAAATAEECSLHRKWLQQRLEEYMVFLSQDSVAKGELLDTKKRGCNCKDKNPCFHATESGKDKTTNLVEKVVIPYSSTEKDGNCTQELKEARADLKTRKVVSRNCSRHLAEERKNKTKATATADACAQCTPIKRFAIQSGIEDLNAEQVQYPTEKGPEEINIRVVRSGTLHQRLDASKMERASAGVKDYSERESAKLKYMLAKLTECSEELATAGETVRWKTKQHNKCAENLVASDHAPLRYLWLMGITCILFLWFAYYVIRNKFHTLMGIRSG